MRDKRDRTLELLRSRLKSTRLHIDSFNSLLKNGDISHDIHHREISKHELLGKELTTIYNYLKD